MTPAAPASPEPIRNVIMMVLLMSTPIREEASLSIAVVRMARPVLVRAMKSCSTSMSVMAEPITKRLRNGTRLSPSVKTHWVGNSCGTLVMYGPTKNWMMFCKMKLTPIAVISGASFGACRRGL